MANARWHVIESVAKPHTKFIFFEVIISYLKSCTAGLCKQSVSNLNGWSRLKPNDVSVELEFVRLAGVIQNLQMVEQANQRLEDDIRRLNRDRGDLEERLNLATRQKTALADEVLNLRKDVDNQGDTIVRLSKEKEELTKYKAELIVQVTASERENRQLSEVGFQFGYSFIWIKLFF